MRIYIGAIVHFKASQILKRLKIFQIPMIQRIIENKDKRFERLGINQRTEKGITFLSCSLSSKTRNSCQFFFANKFHSLSVLCIEFGYLANSTLSPYELQYPDYITMDRHGGLLHGSTVNFATSESLEYDSQTSH